MFTNKSFAYKTEQEAKEVRRLYINMGREVSLIGVNADDEFEFDVYA